MELKLGLEDNAIKRRTPLSFWGPGVYSPNDLADKTKPGPLIFQCIFPISPRRTYAQISFFPKFHNFNSGDKYRGDQKKNTKLFPEHFTYCLREPTLIKRLRRDAWSTSYYLSPPRPTDNWLLSPSLNGTRPPTERNSYLGRPRRRSPFLEGKLRSVQEGLRADYSAISLLC